MSKKHEIYRCNQCGQIVEVMHGAKPAKICCNKLMKLVTENTQEAATEKHIPVVEKVEGGYRVFVGEVEHPMEAAHYIEWIQLFAGNEVYEKHFKPGEKPEAIFFTKADDVYARAYCNLHGLWKSS